MPNRPQVRVTLMLLAALTLAGTGAPGSVRASGAGDWDGHLAFGYSILTRGGGPADAETPGGSMSASAGFDHALGHGWRVGLGLGYHLLGSSNIKRGSLTAGVDHSAFDAALLLSRDLSGRHGLLRVSAGPALLACSATLSTAGGGAGFSDLAVSENAPAAALDLTWMSSRPRPVRIGLETGMRMGFVPDDTWTVFHTRLAVHY